MIGEIELVYKTNITFYIESRLGLEGQLSAPLVDVKEPI